jgi:hypothetical protein
MAGGAAQIGKRAHRGSWGSLARSLGGTAQGELRSRLADEEHIPWRPTVARDLEERRSAQQ